MTFHSPWRSAAAGALLVVVAVMAGTSSCGTDANCGRFPSQHRASAVACSMARSPLIADASHLPLSGNCTYDGDCTMGTNGRCTREGGQDSGVFCTYDDCFQDSDCPSGTACACKASGNACIPAGCRTESDCGGHACSPTVDPCSKEVIGFYCHSGCDACVDDGDCGNFFSYCAYQPQAGKWACAQYCAPG